MIKKPLVSIIMPVYNSEKYVSDAIISVLNQTYNNFELLVIDDNSKDNSNIIISEYIKNDKRIKLIRNEKNLGSAISRNKGISLSVGEYIAFIDSDDTWMTNKLELQMNLAVNMDIKFSYTNIYFTSESGKILKYFKLFPLKIDWKNLLKFNTICCSSVVISKKLIFRKDLFPNINRAEDLFAWINILRTNKEVAYCINLPLVLYRISNSSKSSNKINSSILLLKYYYSFFNSNIFKSILYFIFYSINGIKRYIPIYKEIQRIKINRKN